MVRCPTLSDAATIVYLMTSSDIYRGSEVVHVVAGKRRMKQGQISCSHCASYWTMRARKLARRWAALMGTFFFAQLIFAPSLSVGSESSLNERVRCSFPAVVSVSARKVKAAALHLEAHWES